MQMKENANSKKMINVDYSILVNTDPHFSKALPSKIDYKRSSPYFLFRPHYVIQHTLRQTTQLAKSTMPKNVTFEHVKGHQDDLRNNHNFTLQAKLNILMDKRAASAHTDPTIPTEEMTTRTIHINGNVLTGQPTYLLQREISKCKMKAYYQNFPAATVESYGRYSSMLFPSSSGCQ
jgi:hypothetical protein